MDHQTSLAGAAAFKAKPPQEGSKGNKRLFSEAYDEPELSLAGDNGDGVNQTAPNTAEKRHRASRWPFHSKDNAESSADKRRGRRFGGSGTGKTTPKRNGRSSRFVEGSMNNRASKKPPQEYFAGYDSQSQSEKDESTYVSRHSRQPSQAAMMLKDEKDEPDADGTINRQSGIFKFGSKLAATFNPSNWKIWQKEKPAEDKSIAERIKADAEFKRAYEEVKKRGFIQGNRPAAMASAQRSQRQLNTKQQSDIAMEDDGQSNAGSIDEKARKPDANNPVNTPSRPISLTELETKYQRPFPRTPIKLPAVTPEDSVSNYSSSRSFSPRRGLLLEAFNDDPTRPTRGRIDDPPPPEERRSHALPKKEMEKQLNLVKKVSTLEFKLREAQEELALAMGTPFPPPKTRSGIDYEAIHAIQLQKQVEHGTAYIATTASAFIHPPRHSSRMNGATTSELAAIFSSEYGRPSKHTSRRASVDDGRARSPLAPLVNGESSPRSNTTDTVPTIQLPAYDPEDDDNAATDSDALKDDYIDDSSNQRRVSNTQQRADMSHCPQASHQSDAESDDDTDSMATRTATLKRMKSGPKARTVDVVDPPGSISKVESVRGRVENGEGRGRSLRRPEDGDGFATPQLPATKNRTPSEVSAKSTRSSRIPRPRSRAGTPKRETRERVPPVPTLPVELLDQTRLILKRTGSTKSVKTTSKKLAVETSAQHLKTSPRRVAKRSKETTPTPKHGRRRSTSTTTVHGNAGASHVANKSPSFDSSRTMTKSGSVRGGLHGREREMLPSKEGAFEWGPDVF